MRELLVEIPAQPLQLFRLAQVLGAHGLVELRDERPVVGPARLVRPVMPRPPRLVRVLGVAQVGIFGHVGGVGIARFRGALGQLVGRHLGLFEGHPFGVLGFLGVAFACRIVLAAVLVAALLVLVLRIAAAVVAHVERVEEIMNAVGKTPLVLDELFQAIEIAPGAILDPRAP
jgi:hypothetical protein